MEGVRVVARFSEPSGRGHLDRRRRPPLGGGEKHRVSVVRECQCNGARPCGADARRRPWCRHEMRRRCMHVRSVGALPGIFHPPETRRSADEERPTLRK